MRPRDAGARLPKARRTAGCALAQPSPEAVKIVEPLAQLQLAVPLLDSSCG